MGLKWAVAAVAGILLAGLFICLAAVFIKWLSSLDWTFESASRRAGRHGEEIAAETISRVLKEGDYLLTRNNHLHPKEIKQIITLLQRDGN